MNIKPMSENTAKWLLFIFFICFWGMFYSGTFYASDEIIVARLTQSIVDNHTLTFPPTYGRTDSPYGILNSVLGIPPYIFFKIYSKAFGSAGFFPEWNIFALMNLLISALVVVTLYRFLRHLGYSLNIALLVSTLLGTTTQLFPYSKTFFTEPLFTLFLLSSVNVLSSLSRENALTKGFLIAGLFYGLALLSRFNALFYLPAFLLFIYTTGKGSKITKTLMFSFPVGIAILLVLVLNNAMRGGFFRTGYETSTFCGHIFAGLYGLLLSPGRGFFIYNPWAIVALAMFPLFYRRHPQLALFTLGLFLITLISYAKFWTWHGGWTPGSRFLLPMVPLIFLWLIPLFDKQINDSPYLIFWRGLAIVLFIFSFVLQLGMSLVNVLDYNNELFGLLGGESPFLYIPQVSALAGIPHLIADGKLDIAILKFPSSYAPLIIAIYLVLILLVIVTGRKIYRYVFPKPSVIYSRVRAGLLNFKYSILVTIGVLIVYLIASIFAGPRGLVLRTDAGDIQNDQRLRLNKTHSTRLPHVFTWSGFLEAPSEKQFIFYLKVLGNYDVSID
ncbi:glycosyltransferase family 39 protein, partial [Candidatus Sumerlaeota bacterium]|nr:glycosyltransferase family 39 protein [Candidatus Sumerlaeota bacterium]